ncbi:hypothetical protein C8034_v009290 [Colletotrichum sidae]|uniref:Uncharacterized protein n=1 Tax=Colletotrichum sidae TaxID=1347389 RepID=A0A4R8TMR1_9PEZI|nr:hypothetical protein C8034_v009290 [Colletotrichum sidae]
MSDGIYMWLPGLLDRRVDKASEKQDPETILTNRARGLGGISEDDCPLQTVLSPSLSSIEDVWLPSYLPGSGDDAPRLTDVTPWGAFGVDSPLDFGSDEEVFNGSSQGAPSSPLAEDANKSPTEVTEDQ